jgi:hypothetical protein
MPVSIEKFDFVLKFSVCRGSYFDFGTGRYKPESRKRKWEPYDFTYDSVPQAMLTLFTVQTGEGWPT